MRNNGFLSRPSGERVNGLRLGSESQIHWKPRNGKIIEMVQESSVGAFQTLPIFHYQDTMGSFYSIQGVCFCLQISESWRRVWQKAAQTETNTHKHLQH